MSTSAKAPAWAENVALRRPQFSWTRIKGESNVHGGGGNGSVKDGDGSCVGATGVGADAAVAGAGALAPGQRWKERALAGLALGLKGHVGEPAVMALDAAKRHIGELSMENELLRARARAAERRLPVPPRRSGR